MFALQIMIGILSAAMLLWLVSFLNDLHQSLENKRLTIQSLERSVWNLKSRVSRLEEDQRK